MKIPFDIKFRPQIESGEFKVETRDGLPARVVCWDANSYTPIVCLVTEHDDLDDKDKEYTYSCNNFGRAFSIGAPVDLFIVTPEPELTAFEKVVRDALEYDPEVATEEEIVIAVKEYAAELLSLARKEIVDEWSRGLHDTQDRSGKAYNDGYQLGFERGCEALKDLPRWSPNDIYPELNDVVIGSIGTGDHFFIHRGRIIHLESLEKLPGFKED